MFSECGQKLKEKIRATLSSTIFLHAINYMGRQVEKKKAVKLDERLHTVRQYASLRHLSSFSSFYMREFEPVGKQRRGEERGR